MATAGESASLPIEIDGPAQASQTSVLIVKGLPAGASLSKGTVLATGDWSLIASEATGLAIALPSSAAGRHQLTIEMRSSDAGVIASVRSMLEVANTPSRAGMADAVRPPEATTLEWLGEAKRLMSAGHIASARLLLERAADSGLAEAARLLGDTYDPAKLYALGVRGVSGDIQRAINWYERADELGDPQAKARLLALGAR
jgi:TPR repeat protein